MDESFLPAFFTKAIDAPELKDEAKLFLKDFSQSPETILELIHADYRAQETGDQLCDTDVVVKPRSIIRRAGTKQSSNPAKKEWRLPKFPVNFKNQIPPEYYKRPSDSSSELQTYTI